MNVESCGDDAQLMIRALLPLEPHDSLVNKNRPGTRSGPAGALQLAKGAVSRHTSTDTMAKDNAARQKWSLFEAEAAYADSIFRSAIGDSAGCIQALERAIEIKPTYAPAVLSMGSVEYQRNRKAKGRNLLLSLVAMPDDTVDIVAIIDKAGDFLIGVREYADGLELYRAAARRFPEVAVMHQGRGCCAGHMGELEEAVAASRRALELEPDNQKFVNDLGWSLAESGALQEARVVLERAVAIDPADELARENLRLCNLRFAKRPRRKSA